MGLRTIWNLLLSVKLLADFLACVASVSVGFGSKERDFWCFARAENRERAKNAEPHRNACYAGYWLLVK